MMNSSAGGLSDHQSIERTATHNVRRIEVDGRRLSDWKVAERLLQSQAWSADLVSLAIQLQQHDPPTWQHCQRVAKLVSLTCRELQLASTVSFHATLGGLFHDVGKLAIATALLQKPERLIDCEMVTLRQHPALGAALIVGEGRELEQLRTHILQHHERLDGAGYPAGLRCEAIALESRIITLCDSYDSQTQQRPYARTRSHEAAMAELTKHTNTQFDPLVLQAFNSLFD